MESGLDLEKQIPTPVEAELFFLTSLFIELIEPDLGEETAQTCAIGLVTTVNKNVCARLLL